jgi:uncharacterized phage protein gp47/JayE
LVDAITIPAGTVFSNPTTSVRYLTEEAVTANAGAMALSVMVRCSVTGSSGNTDANSITQVIGYTLPNTAVIGNAALNSGTDGETEDSRIIRFNDFIDSLVRGTPSAVAHAARHQALYDANGNVLEYVSRLGYVESMGWAGLYVYCGGGKPSNAMLQAIQTTVDGYVDTNGSFVPGYRPCGINVDIASMFEQTIDLGLLITKYPGAVEQDIIDGIRTAVGNLFDATPNNSILRLEQITSTVLNVAGVSQCWTTNAENLTLGADNVIKLGDLNITWN